MIDTKESPRSELDRFALTASLMVSATASRLRTCRSVDDIPAIADELDAWVAESIDMLEQSSAD